MSTSLPSRSTIDVSHRQLMQQVEHQLKELSKTPDVVISSLPPDSYLYGRYVRAFNIVKQFYYNATAEEYQEVVKYISTLPRPAKIDVGTFGSYIFGCLYNVPSDGNFMCSPLCANSIPPHKGEIEACSSQVWYMQGDSLIYRSGSGSDAVVFQVTTSLTPSQWDQLVANGAKRVTLYTYLGEPIESRDLTAITPITTPPPTIPASTLQPPIVAQQAVVTTPPIAAQQAVIAPVTAVAAATPSAAEAIARASRDGVQRGITSFFSDWKVILIGIVVIILIGLLIYGVYYALKKKTDTQAQGQPQATGQVQQPQPAPVATPRT